MSNTKTSAAAQAAAQISEEAPVRKAGKQLQRRKAKVTLEQSSPEWDFKENEVFIGCVINENRADVPNREDKTKIDKDKLIGYVVEDEDGERWTIPNWALIEKAFNVTFDHPEYKATTIVKCIQEENRPLIQIEYGGQGTKSNGDSFTILNIDILDFDGE